jgi:hypothetical protein
MIWPETLGVVYDWYDPAYYASSAPVIPKVGSR